MTVERMTYSNKQVNISIHRAKNIKMSTPTKASYWGAWSEMKIVYEYCMDNINSILFDVYNGYFAEFQKLLNDAFYSDRKVTKAQLEQAKRDAYKYLVRELDEIRKSMDAGEVNVVA